MESAELTISICFSYDDNGESRTLTHPYCHVAAFIQRNKALCRAVSDALDVSLGRSITELNVNARLQRIVARQGHRVR